MIGSILIGCLAAFVVFLPQYLRWKFPYLGGGVFFFVLGAVAILLSMNRFLLDLRSSRGYNGFAQLFASIYSSLELDSSLYWAFWGAISFLLTLLGGFVGPEGAAIEWAQALQLRNRIQISQWFEQRRRTDIGTGLAAGISAAFCAPFAGVLVPIELGIGGRSLFSVVSSISAFLCFHFLMSQFSFELFDVRGVLSGLSLSSWQQWLGVMLLGVGSGLIAAGLIFIVHLAYVYFRSLFPNIKVRLIVVVILLVPLFWMHKSSSIPFSILFEQVLWGKYSIHQVGFFLLTQMITLILVFSGIGSMGLFWPLFSVGGLLGYSFHHFFFGLTDVPVAAGLIGAASFLGAVLEIPITSAVLVWEMTQSIEIFFPCLFAALIARFCRQILGSKALIRKILEAQGLCLLSGRSVSLLDQLTVRETMCTNYTVIHEHDLVSELSAKLKESSYPFLPVVNAQGKYVGLLTPDLSQTAFHEQSASALSDFLEVKDLLYRSGLKIPVAKINDRLSSVIEFFEEIPCIPVVNERSEVLGLLFIYNIRLAYDREMAFQPYVFGLKDASRHAK